MCDGKIMSSGKMYTQEAVIFYLSAYSSDRRLEKGSFYVKIA